VQQVAGSVVTPRAGLAEWRQRAHDQSGILFAQGLVLESQRCQKPRLEAFQNNVGYRCQTPKKLAAICTFEIEGYAAFGRIVIPERQTPLRVGNIVEKWPDTAAGLAAGRFNLDHVRSEIADELAAELALFVCKFEHPDACQRARRSLDIAHRSISSM